MKRALLSTEQLGASDIGYLNANEWGNKLARAKRHLNVNDEMSPIRLLIRNLFSVLFSFCFQSIRRLPANRRVMQREPFDLTNELRRIRGVSKEIFLYRAIVAAVKNRRWSK